MARSGNVLGVHKDWQMLEKTIKDNKKAWRVTAFSGVHVGASIEFFQM